VFGVCNTEAIPVIHAHATRGLSGPLPGRICDSALLLAALAHAEGDDDCASDLLVQMGVGLEPGSSSTDASLRQNWAPHTTTPIDSDAHSPP
jgi:hypothetical protein